MNKLRLAALGLLLTLPLVSGCDTGGAATAVATAIPTSVGGPAEATATALPTVVSSSATDVATAASGAATTVATMAPGGATALATAVNGALTAEDTAYLRQVYDIGTKVASSKELNDANTALIQASTNAVAGGTVDTAALNTKLNTATTFMTGIANQAAALKPSANMQAVQNELMKSVTDWQGSLTAAQTAVGSQNATTMASAAGQMVTATTDVAQLLSDLAARGMK